MSLQRLLHQSHRATRWGSGKNTRSVRVRGVGVGCEAPHLRSILRVLWIGLVRA